MTTIDILKEAGMAKDFIKKLVPKVLQKSYVGKSIANGITNQMRGHGTAIHDAKNVAVAMAKSVWTKEPVPGIVVPKLPKRDLLGPGGAPKPLQLK